MKRLYSIIVLALLTSVGALAQTKWYNPLDGDEPHIQGRAWNAEIGKSFNRFPLRAKGVVRPPVWSLSTNSAGLSISFYSNSPEIIVKYTVSHGLSLPNVGTIATSGLDLYVTDCHGETNWCACPGNYNFGANQKDTIVYHYTNLEYHNYGNPGSEYQLFLPLYNSVTSMQIGVAEKSVFSFVSQPKEKPIVVYGTSIAQGASASRPAMAWTNIVERRTESPVINLGFSGNALMDASVYDLLSEIDAQMFILDCMPNMYRIHDSIVVRTIAGVQKIRKKSQAPILLVENDGYMYGKTNKPIENECNVTNSELHKAYEQLQSMGVKDVYYLTKEEIGLTPDSQVDGWHVSDVGMQLYADAYVKKINDILDRHPMPLFTPCKQNRDGLYLWNDRHNEVLELNHTTNPEILMLGNSITHFWAGNPVSKVQRGPKSWAKLFGKKHVTNMGFGWDRIENVFWRIYHGELDGCHPKQIFMMIGTNNLDKNTNEEIVDGILGLVKLIRQRQSQVKLHVVKIYPRRKLEARLADLNNLLQSKLTVDENTDIIDITNQLTLSDGSGKIDESLFVDGLHPNEKGYTRIADVLKKYLK
jgi:lysophospholipase L1-like esterase